MFKKSRKDTLVEQAQSLASDISEAIAPHVERARDEVGPRLADARDALAPKIADAKDAISPKLADARDQAAPYVESARETLVKDVVPAVKEALEEAREQAGPLADEAKRRGSLAAAALEGEDVKRKGGKKKYFLFAGLIAGGVVVYRKLTSGDESANWQSSYTPPPAPAPAAPPAPPSPSAPMAGSHVAEAPVDSSGDTAGANPGETLSDAAEAPHEVTTPDAPAEEVEVTDEAAADAAAKAKKKA